HVCFFCSSRRRHTRSKRDWSSDVCSSDLPILDYHLGPPVLCRQVSFVPLISFSAPVESVRSVSLEADGSAGICRRTPTSLYCARSEERRVGKEGGTLGARRAAVVRARKGD